MYCANGCGSIVNSGDELCFDCLRLRHAILLSLRDHAGGPVAEKTEQSVPQAEAQVTGEDGAKTEDLAKGDGAKAEGLAKGDGAEKKIDEAAMDVEQKDGEAANVEQKEGAAGAEAQQEVNPEAADETKTKKEKPVRCFTCRKRLGFSGITCRCGDTFCYAHRYTNEHDCPFDYQAMGAEEIRRNNPVVKAPKIRFL